MLVIKNERTPKKSADKTLDQDEKESEQENDKDNQEKDPEEKGPESNNDEDNLEISNDNPFMLAWLDGVCEEN